MSRRHIRSRGRQQFSLRHLFSRKYDVLLPFHVVWKDFSQTAVLKPRLFYHHHGVELLPRYRNPRIGIRIVHTLFPGRKVTGVRLPIHNFPISIIGEYNSIPAATPYRRHIVYRTDIFKHRSAAGIGQSYDLFLRTVFHMTADQLHRVIPVNIIDCFAHFFCLLSFRFSVS